MFHFIAHSSNGCQPSPSPPGVFDIVVNYSGPSEYSASITSAVESWKTFVKGFVNNRVVNLSSPNKYKLGDNVGPIYVNVDVLNVDGGGSVLAYAGPTALFQNELGQILPTEGDMVIDSADIGNSALELIIIHEIAHVLGFGTLWTNNNLYVNDSGNFLGTNANSKWATEYTGSGSAPVELDGDFGTANSHWNEGDQINVNNGKTLSFELMTGNLNEETDQVYLSNMSVASLEDLGYIVDYNGLPTLNARVAYLTKQIKANRNEMPIFKCCAKHMNVDKKLRKI